MSGPPLWVIERDGVSVYLFGVRPVFGDLPWMTPAVEDALERSMAFWTETQPIEELARSPLIAAYGLSPDVSLRDRLDDETYRRFERVAADAGIDPDALHGVRPWLALQILRGAVSEPIWSGPRMDDQLTEIATQRGMTVSFEFDAEGIVRMFADLPTDVEIDVLRMELDELERGATHMVDRYRRGIAGDVSFEEAEAQRVADAYPELYRRLLIDRNRAWLPRVDDALRTGTTTFIAVGTMHLVGPDNVRMLLGDRVRQVA